MLDSMQHGLAGDPECLGVADDGLELPRRRRQVADSIEGRPAGRLDLLDPLLDHGLIGLTSDAGGVGRSRPDGEGADAQRGADPGRDARGGDHEVVGVLVPTERGRHPRDPGGGLAAVPARRHRDRDGGAVHQSVSDAAQRHAPEEPGRGGPHHDEAGRVLFGHLQQADRSGARVVDQQRVSCNPVRANYDGSSIVTSVDAPLQPVRPPRPQWHRVASRRPPRDERGGSAGRCRGRRDRASPGPRASTRRPRPE